MRRLRDVFYIYKNMNENYYIYYGMEFNEFRQYSPIPLENLLLLAGGEVVGESYNPVWHFETIQGAEQVKALENEDLYALGNFHWVDYKSEDLLNSCTPEEKAELLYLSHFGRPLHSSFVERIQNNFAYLAHDDGWYCKLFCKDMSIMVDILEKKLIAYFSTTINEPLPEMSTAIKLELAHMMGEGLFIDLEALITCFDESYSLALYSIGKFNNMDEVYNNRKRHMLKASRKCYLEYKQGSWCIETYDS